ncbi:hypothetical protein EJB05_49956, partial [Eragrostis curvula]
SSRRHHGPPPHSALDSDDVLREILVRLPTEPSSLPLASLVCKRWLRLVSDPVFVRRYRARHVDPLLLGVFIDNGGYPIFRSIHDPPDRIPAEHFIMPRDEWGDGVYWDLIGVRHGRVVVFSRKRSVVMVWDPATCDLKTVAAPPEFDDNEKIVFNGALVCAATDEGHVHGDCHSSPFNLVLIGIHDGYRPVYASFYSSETGIWGDLITTECPPIYSMDKPSILIGNSLYWLFRGDEEGILQFDLGTRRLSIVEMPPDLMYYSNRSLQIMPAEDGGIRLAILSCQIMDIWECKTSSDGVVEWVMEKKIELGVALGLGRMGGMDNLIKAFDEDYEFIFVRTEKGVFMIHLESMQFKNLGSQDDFYGIIHPYSAFATAVGDLARGERWNVGMIERSMNESVSKADSTGAGAAVDNTADGSVQTDPEQGMVDDENLENIRNHDQRVGAGFKCEYCKRTRKVGSANRLTKHRAWRNHIVVACPGVPPKIRKFTRFSLNKAKQRKKESKHRRAKKRTANLQHQHMGSTFEHGGGSSSGYEDLAHTGEPTETQTDTLSSEETASELGKAWAKWFRSNGIPGIKADCPHFRRAMELTQQLGAGERVPTGAQIDGTYLDDIEEELNEHM